MRVFENANGKITVRGPLVFVIVPLMLVVLIPVTLLLCAATVVVGSLSLIGRLGHRLGRKSA
ncbi:hypothetical protein [Rhizorhabdus wittichii]|uniref:hypothetical protein n=1 Tax=Rhizorhabdus wittichii TaxID=160791 RepID=UPI00035FFD70|nr:hypothetical protein [Rhizorhabdus wittichii]